MKRQNICSILLLLPHQNAQIWEIRFGILVFLQNQFTNDSALSYLLSE